ncbi:MAG: lytic murein transglycosylase [Hyphomicrobiaceae bacterium]|nr:lytic murein transglycosylase [Hyphomicrobiaceae bacterium]
MAMLCVSASSTVALAAAADNYPPPRNGCTNTANFDTWLPGLKKDALAAGIKPETVSAVLDGVTPDMSILKSDRGQSFFQQTFLDFQAKLATQNRVNSGAAKIRLRKPIFDAVQKEFGVPAEVITGFWALESDFGAGMGKKPVLRALVTLAYDCRRSEMFRDQVLYAMKIIDRGDLKPEEMVGSWAGELGQTQFLPVHYYNHAIDYDKDGRRDLIRTDADIIASTASFIKSLDWKAGEPWLQEVRVPDNLPWDKAGLDIKLPRSDWSKLGVTYPDGRKVPADATSVSLLLPMGRLGPAFLAYQNFGVYLKWNQSLNYGITAAYLATRIAGAPVMGRGNGQPVGLDGPQLKELQVLLTKRGYKVGEPDGKLGAGTRIAARQAQLKAGLPADGYPSPELLDAMRAGR